MASPQKENGFTPRVRKNPSKRLRFYVLCRDGFACVYCGAKAPTVVLHADHIKPVVEGGSTTPTNLATACEGCNQGKGRRALGEAATTQLLDRLATASVRDSCTPSLRLSPRRGSRCHRAENADECAACMARARVVANAAHERDGHDGRPLGKCGGCFVVWDDFMRAIFSAEDAHTTIIEHTQDEWDDRPEIV